MKQTDTRVIRERGGRARKRRRGKRERDSDVAEAILVAEVQKGNDAVAEISACDRAKFIRALESKLELVISGKQLKIRVFLALETHFSSRVTASLADATFSLVNGSRREFAVRASRSRSRYTRMVFGLEKKNDSTFGIEIAGLFAMHERGDIPIDQATERSIILKRCNPLPHIMQTHFHGLNEIQRKTDPSNSSSTTNNFCNLSGPLRRQVF